MNTKTQELVTAGYALAKGLDAESAKLVKKLADELAVQRVRADELNKQVVNLAVENATVKERHCFIRALGMSILEHSGGRCDWRGAMEDASELIQTVNAVYAALPATDVAIANIQAQVWLEAKDFTKSMLATDSVDHIDFLFDGKAKQLRKEAGHA